MANLLSSSDFFLEFIGFEFSELLKMFLFQTQVMRTKFFLFVPAFPGELIVSGSLDYITVTRLAHDLFFISL